MALKNRIKELRHIRAGDLHPNPRNWRTHPAPQQAALQAVLEEVGIAGALIARETADGQERSTGCKVQGQAVKEVTVNPLKDTPAANQFPAA